MKHFVIWQNTELNADDWRDDCIEFCDVNGIEYNENKLFDWIVETNDEYLNDERANLDFDVDGDIIVIADLGLWSGRRPAYKELKTRNVADILYSNDDYIEFFADAHNVRARGYHHDGTNNYLYRYFKPHLSDTQKQNFLDKIARGAVTPRDVSRYTCSLFPVVANVYGWR